MKQLSLAALYLVCFLTLTVFSEPILKDSKVAVPENGTLVLSDSFDSLSEDYKAVYLEGAAKGGSHKVSDGKLIIKAKTPAGGVFNEHHPRNPESIYAVYNTTPISGHFYAEVEFDEDNACGLALIQVKDGKPDTENFTSMRIHTSPEGNVFVILRDRQKGNDDVWDNTGLLKDRGRYYTVLGHQYSLPFHGTNKKIRIFRDGPAGFFHFYYAVKAKIHGEWAEGWMEIAPSKDWGKPGKDFYVGLYARSCEAPNETVAFDNLKVMQKPTEDADDRQTGFKAVRREYNWSGFFGDAVVISFDEDFEFHERGQKFVFWSRTNYVPCWHMSNQFLYSYEFVETKGGGYAGCHEPMSDRILRWSRVEILEDNDVRKVVHWYYVPCNPDYCIPHDGLGTELPEVNEYWTFYPDGTAVKYFTYTPKLDTGHRSWYEFMELIPIAGSTSDPVDHVDHPTLHLMNLKGDIDTYHPGPRDNGGFNPETNKWKQMISVAHFKNMPDAFNAWSTDPRVPDTYSHYNIYYDISWHKTGRFRLSHWPVGLEPWQGNVASRSTWTAEVAHSGLMGGGYFIGGLDWDEHYKVDGRGRKYRDWSTLVGLNKPDDFEGVKNMTKSWLFPGKVKMLEQFCRFEKINYGQKELVFTNTAGKTNCYFTVDPTGKSTTLINPVFKINNFKGSSAKVTVDGKVLSLGKDFRFALEKGAAVVWVKGRFSSVTEFKIQAP